MSETKSHDYAWNKGWIEFEAPNAPGVYWLQGLMRDETPQSLWTTRCATLLPPILQEPFWPSSAAAEVCLEGLAGAVGAGA
ncbi:MAG TPA: hypothetical protein VMW54_04895 [Terriglobia bacterium]|nr:hypothetical protein [Terriglobia bacterium]